MHTHIHTFINVPSFYVCMYVCMYIRMYVCMHKGVIIYELLIGKLPFDGKRVLEEEKVLSLLALLVQKYKF